MDEKSNYEILTKEEYRLYKLKRETQLQEELMEVSRMIMDMGVSPMLLSKFERLAIARHHEIVGDKVVDKL